MKLSKEKVVPVTELKPVLAIKRREDFVQAFGKLLMKAIEAYSTADRLSFQLMLNMADFVINHDLYDDIIEIIRDKSWVKKKVDALLLKWGLSEKPEDLDINELITFGTTHYYCKKWGNPNHLKDDLNEFATTSL